MELTPEEAQTLEDSSTRPTPTHQEKSKPEYKVYRMDVEVEQASAPVAQECSSSPNGAPDTLAVQPQPTRPYRFPRPARPASAIPVHMRCSTENVQPARPKSAFARRPGNSTCGKIESGIVSDEAHGPSAAPPTSMRPWSAHARLTYRGDDALRSGSYEVVSKEHRASQQATSGLPDKALSRRPTSARARQAYPSWKRKPRQETQGYVVGRSAWSLAATFDSPLCIVPSATHRHIISSRIQTKDTKPVRRVDTRQLLCSMA